MRFFFGVVCVGWACILYDGEHVDRRSVCHSWYNRGTTAKCILHLPECNDARLEKPQSVLSR